MKLLTIADLVRENAQPLVGLKHDFDPLLDLIGDRRLVLLGEATHGTHEFYRARAEITKRLILEKGFTVVAWEADWPDALRVNRFIRGKGEDQSSLESLSGFRRFPTWMWRNADILNLIGWLRNHNETLLPKKPLVGVYGLDLYSLYSSIQSVVAYLEKVDSVAAKAARRRYSCFEDFADDPQAYGLTASRHQSLSCENEVVAQLREIQQRSTEFLSRDGRIAADELFFAEQNARLAKNAEHYYRALYRGRANTWNLRDTHMADTLGQLMHYLEKHGEHPKAIVWAHNSHLGDARATEMSERGELNLGQLMRERYGDDVVLVGFTTYRGTVTAASDWDMEAERKRIRPALEESFEKLFHEAGVPEFLLIPQANEELATELRAPLLERAIGVVYHPHTERWSHYFHAKLSDQFDAVLHYDETRAVEPLERTTQWNHGELPDTYPSGM